MADPVKNTRVLIAEDSLTQAAMLRAILEEEHFEVGVARDGREAALVFDRESFDIVLSDIVMPEMDGFALCRRIKTGNPARNVPVILLTGMSDPLEIARGLDAGADDFVVKPYDPADLVGKIRNALAAAATVTLPGRAGNGERGRMIGLVVGGFEATTRKGRALEVRNAELAATGSASEQDAWKLRRDQNDILDAAGDGIVGLDRDGVVTFINPSAVITLGWQGESLTGRGAHELFMHSRPDRSPSPREETPVHAVLAGEASYHGAEAVFWRRDGGAVPVEHTCTPMRDGAGAVTGAVLAFRDISARKQSEAEREKLEAEFRQSHKMEAVGRLAGGVAHDFNNLLTVITGFSELILAGPVPDEITRRRVVQIQEAARHAVALIRQLLAFSRRQVLHPAPISLGDTVTGLDGIIRQLAGTGHAVTLTLDPGAGRVMADAGQVGQVLVNLVVNAADAMPAGGRIEIGVADADPAGDPEAPVPPHPGPHVRLTVSDTGTGMSPETKARIFEPFFTTKPPGSGTGLGLSTVFGIVQQSGGVMSVHTVPDRGTTFSIYLPRLADSAGDLPAGTGC